MAALAFELSRGALKAIKANQEDGEVVLQVKELQPKDGGKFMAVLTDGAEDLRAILSSQASVHAKDGTMRAGSIVKVVSHSCSTTPNGPVLMVTELEVLSIPGTQDVDMQAVPTPVAADACAAISLAGVAAAGARKAEISTPGAAAVAGGTPGPAPRGGGAVVAVKVEPSPSNLRTPGSTGGVKRLNTGTTAGGGGGGSELLPFGSGAPGPTPPSAPSAPRSAGPVGVSQRTTGLCKISDLHPYEEQWRLRAKLAHKDPLRSIKLRGVDSSVFSVELVDDEGGQIRGTFWRNQAERWSQALEEGKVYVFERFSVKPANKAYSSVRNDYEIAFTDKTEVSEAADQSAGAHMTAAVEVVPLEQLPRYITRKMLVDVLGVVVSVGASGTVKRKSDMSELARRDVTLADKSGKTVTLTLWGDNVDATAELEPSGPHSATLLQVTSCRVTDFNGCSLSTVSKSQITINPQALAAPDGAPGSSGALALELEAWWTREGGSSAALQPLGGAADGAGRGRAGQGGAPRSTSSLKEVTAQPVPDLDAKPVYHNVIATVAYVNPEQTLYYLANPETGRKVVAQEDGRYFSQGDNKYVDRASHRYVLSLKAMDASGDAWLNLFNEQAELVMAVSADELHALKGEDEQRFVSRVKAAQWSDWAFTVSTKSREYQGERRMRHTVMGAKPVSYAQEGQRILALVQAYA